MTSPAILSTDHEEMISALGVYHLMTVEQMRRVGVANGSKRRVEAAATLLIRKHLIARNPAKTLSPGDRIPAVHWLVPKGAAVSGSAKGAERRFKGATQTWHRLAIVDVHIALQAWAHEAGAKVVRFLADFEPSGQRQRKPTSLSYGGHDYHPDALARVDLADGTPAVFALEFVRGGAIEDRQPFRDGLAHWRGVAEDEVVEHELGLDHPARFVVVFQSADMRRKALADWAAPSATVWGRFFCKGLDELGPDFNGGWWQPGRPTTNLF